MKPDVFHGIPDITLSRAAIGLGLAAATPVIAWETKQLIDSATASQSKSHPESTSPQIVEDLANSEAGDGGFPSAFDGAEVVLLSNFDVQPRIVVDLESLRAIGVI